MKKCWRSCFHKEHFAEKSLADFNKFSFFLPNKAKQQQNKHKPSFTHSPSVHPLGLPSPQHHSCARHMLLCFFFFFTICSFVQARCLTCRICAANAFARYDGAPMCDVIILLGFWSHKRRHYGIYKYTPDWLVHTYILFCMPFILK